MTENYLVGPEKHLIHYNSRLIVKYIWPVSTKNDKLNSRYLVEIEVHIATIEPVKLFPDQLDSSHPLTALGRSLNWASLEQNLQSNYSDKGIFR